MNLNDYVLPAPGSLVCGVGGGPSDRSKHVVYTVIAAREEKFPSSWRQYFLTLVGCERVLDLDIECTDFHHNWHVILRPGYP